MRAWLIGNIPSLTSCLHPRLPQSFHFAAPVSSLGRKDLLLTSGQGLSFSRSGFLHHLTGSLCRALVSRRGYKGTAVAMASDFQPQLARQPPSAPLPKAPNGGKYKLAVCQMAVTSNKGTNIVVARERIEAAADNGAELIVLPEMWNCPYSNDSFPIYAEDIDAGHEASPSTAMLSEAARKNKVTIVAGSIPERSNGNLYNTCCVFDKNGELKAKFRKIHLFDIDIPGKITFKESDTLTAGEGLCVVDTDVGRIGLGICYDIRFPEMAMLYAARGFFIKVPGYTGAHIICYPGAFNMTTGPLHWELLQKARAVDNQIFVVTCSPARDTSAGYIAWGHSTVVGPGPKGLLTYIVVNRVMGQFGEILATTEHDEATVVADIDYSQLDTRRQNMPLEFQRRGDLYHLTDVTRKDVVKSS